MTDQMTTEVNAEMWGDVAETFAFLSHLANNVPTESSVPELMDAVRAAARGASCTDGEADVEVAQPEGMTMMAAYACEHEGDRLEDLVRELAVDWTLVFRGMSPQNGPTPPYAGVWLGNDGVGVKEMFEVNRQYTAVGLGAGSMAHNRFDYLGIELEFVSHMARRVAEGDAEARSRIANFIDAYLLSWIDRFVAQVDEKAKTDFWKGYLRLVSSSLKETRELL